MRAHSARDVGVPQHRPAVVEALGAQRLADHRVVVAVAPRAREGPPVRAGPAHCAGAGTAGVASPETSLRCTGPNEGAVRVTKSWGWATTDGLTPLPPRMPAATSCQASAW